LQKTEDRRQKAEKAKRREAPFKCSVLSHLSSVLWMELFFNNMEEVDPDCCHQGMWGSDRIMGLKIASCVLWCWQQCGIGVRRSKASA